MKKYQKTLYTCYLGFITQAIAANFAPLLFLRFNYQYGISFGKIAMIPLVFFFTQLIVDGLCARFVKMSGYRLGCVISEICAASGLIGLAVLPEVLPDPFVGILISVIIYAVGSGLIEVLVSPIVEACPFENKEATMSLLHSFYCWGSVAVVLLSTVFFACFGVEHWKIMACIWAIIPIINAFNFATCPIVPLVEEGKGMSIMQLVKTPLFWVAVVLMISSGASELTMGQWASAFVESAIGLTKTLGDLTGPCLFAVMQGISRVFYGKYGNRIDLTRFMIGSGILCLICYLVSALSPLPVVGLMGCIICGFSVGIMWPGTISLSSSHFPTGGTALFALLAMAGDLGGSVGPSLAGIVAQNAGDNLHMGILAGTVFPVTLVLFLFMMSKMTRKNKKS